MRTAQAQGAGYKSPADGFSFPVPRRRVKGNRVKIPGDPVTVSGERRSERHCAAGHEKALLPR